MKKIWKQTLACVLTCIMLFSCVSLGTALAAEPYQSGEDAAFSIRAGETINVQVERTDYTLIKFEPEVSGTYTFTSLSDSDTYGYLFDADMHELARDDDGGDNDNFSITYDFTGGKTYYFGAAFYSVIFGFGEISGSFDVTLTLDHASPCNHRNTENRDLVEPTCTENGYTAGVFCLDCKEWISGHALIKRQHTDADGDNVCDLCDSNTLIIGDHLTWTLNKYGVLTIRGDGEMYDMEDILGEDPSDDVYPPFYGYDIKKVIIEDGVTSIGEGMFAECKMESVEIAKSVKKIGMGAFNACIYLNSVTFEKGSELTSIGDIAFAYDLALESIDIPDSVTEIGPSAFDACLGLKKIYLPANLKSIPSCAFGECWSLESLVIPESVKAIAEDAFLDCPLKTVVVVSNDLEFVENDVPLFGYTDIETIDMDSVFSCMKKIFENDLGYIELTEEEVAELEEKADAGVHYYDEPQRIEGFTIVAHEGSKAEAYAEKNGFIFVSLDGTHEHSFTASVTQEASCTESGVRTYSCECGYSYTETIPANGHTEVIDHAVEATCTSEGLTQGTHCSVCNTVLVEQTVVPKKEHTPSEAVIENEISASCDKEGSYEEVIYCAECRAELGREKKVTAKLEHSYTSKTVDPACEEDGYTVHTCSVCGDSYKENFVDATGHMDSDNDGYCDNCKKHLAENPSADCTCICHKGGFFGFLYKIARFFWKLFQTHKTCACGVAHY